MSRDEILARSQEIKDIAKQYLDKSESKYIDLTSGKPVEITVSKEYKKYIESPE